VDHSRLVQGQAFECDARAAAAWLEDVWVQGLELRFRVQD
jgi:hypothetical protein